MFLAVVANTSTNTESTLPCLHDLLPSTPWQKRLPGFSPITQAEMFLPGEVLEGAPQGRMGCRGEAGIMPGEMHLQSNICCAAF